MIRIAVLLLAVTIGLFSALLPGSEPPAPQLPPSGQSDPDTPRWPPAPEPARIRWVGELSGPSDLGVRRSFWSRVRRLFGADDRRRHMVRPYGVVSDSRGRILVVDADARTVHVFDPGRRNYRTLGDPGFLQLPIGIALGPGDSIYLTDAVLKSVIRYNRRGRRTGRFGGEDELQRPAGIAFSRVTNLIYVVDVLAHQIVAYETDGRLSFRFGQRGEADGEFNFPTNIAVDREGFVYVTDSLNFRVQIFDPEGKFISVFGRSGDAIGDFSKPKGIAVDTSGHIYVVEGLYDTILIYDRDGRLLLNFGDAGAGPGQFWLASGIAIDDSDRIYVADSYNHRVQVFQYLEVAE